LIHNVFSLENFATLFTTSQIF